MKCKEHPRYVPTRKPKNTVKHPDGCPTCWRIWEHEVSDPRRLAGTVTIELLTEEARALVLALEQMLHHGGQIAALNGRIVRPFFHKLAQAVKEQT